MTLERRIRLIAGIFVLSTLALGRWVDPRFLLLTALVGANLVQSSITGWCLIEDFLRALKLDGGEAQ